MSWFLAFAGFAFLIIVHEAGHFAAAKAVGMRVERFFLFFPPKVISFRRGETEYGIGAIPLGGFVKISGMNPDEAMPPEAAGRGYYDQPVWKRIVVIGAGPAINIVLAFAILFFLAFGIQESSDKVAEVRSDAPAQGIIKPDDRVISVDGVTGPQIALSDQINSHECAGEPTDGCAAATPAKIVVERDGVRRALLIRPQYDSEFKRNLVGMSFATRDLNPSVGQAFNLSTDLMWRVSTKTFSVLSRLFESKQREQISGVVGNYEVTRQAIDSDSRTALTLLAVISLSLGLINLLPFLPLDGGHIFWSLVEKVRGRRVPLAVMERASVVGFALVMILFVIGFTNDIGRLTGEGFNLR